jgi:thiamine-phosphate pyrophosphorylase
VDRRRVSFRLYLITDRNLAARRGGVVAVAEAALSAASASDQPGAVALQLREKDMEARPLYELARALRELCSRYGAALLVNDRVDVAIAAGADGVHLPANSFAVADARRLVGATRLIGVSTHEAGEVGGAAAAGADFAVYGPVYEPLSKASYGAAPRPQGNRPPGTRRAGA